VNLAFFSRRNSPSAGSFPHKKRLLLFIYLASVALSLFLWCVLTETRTARPGGENRVGELKFLIFGLILAGGCHCAATIVKRVETGVREREKLLEQLRDAENKYRVIFDNALEGIFQSTPEGKFITANESLAKMWGYDTPAQLLSEMSNADEKLYVVPGRWSQLLQTFQRHYTVLGFVSEVYRKDGRPMWISQNVRGVRDAQGQLVYVEGTVEDITAQWLADRRRSLLHGTTTNLAEAATVAEARPKILQAICEILEWDMGAVWDVDKGENVLRCVEVWHRPNIDIEEFEAATSRMTVPPGEGLAGRVWQTGELDWIPDIARQAAFPDAAIALHNGMRSAFGVPVKVRSEVIHVLEFFSPKVSHADPELLQMLAAIGDQLGQLIEHKRGVEALRESDARKAAILDSAMDCIITFDEKGRIGEFNPAAERAFGFPKAFALGKDLFELIIPPSLREGYRRAALLSGEAEPVPALGRRMELVARRADQSEIPVEMALSRIELNGRPMFTAYIRDITERRRAERTRSELAAVVESSSDAIIGKTLDGIIVSWNGAAERLYGHTAADAMGRHIYIVVPADRLDELPQTLAAVQRGESLVNFETVRIRKDGQRIAVTVTESPIRNERGHITGISSIVRDITERKKLENQLLQSQKMEAVGRLAGGVAHDFNNILTAVLGYSDLLLRQIQPGHPMHRQLSEIKKAGEFAASLTHQLLAFSRRQELQPKVLSLNDAVGNIQKMLRRLIDEDIRIMILPDKNAGNVKADPAQLGQVIMNLAVNARDAMPRGGILTIETSNAICEKDGVPCQTHGIPAGEYVKLTLSDTGTGMTDEVKQHLFEPFFTTKEKGQGTGLGLATCYGIVKQSGGCIVVESAVGQGSSFHVYLPRVNNRGVLFPASAAAGRMPRGHETILLVEDEAGVRTLAAQILRRLGYSVIEAEDGDEAHEVVRNMHGSKIDLLLADVVLPNSGGRELLDWMEETQDGAKVLFTSGYVKEIVCKKYDLPAEVPFLQKPFTPADLARKVREIIES